MDDLRQRPDVTIIQMLLGGERLFSGELIVKPLDETRTNDNTLTPDTHLQFATLPNTIYYIRCAFILRSDPVPDFQWRVAHTGTTTAAMLGARRAADSVDLPSSFIDIGTSDFWMIDAAMMAAGTANTADGGSGATNRSVAYFAGILSVGASGGVFSMEWAQVNSDVGLTTVYAVSWLHRQVVSSEVSIKAASTSRTGTTTATADPDLQKVLTSGVDYALHMGVTGNAGATPDFKIGIDDGGGTPTYFGGFVNISENAYDRTAIPVDNEQILKPIAALTGSVTQPMTGDGTANFGNHYGLAAAARFSVSANPFSLIWAQNTSSGTATTIHAGSYLLARPIASPDVIVWKTSDEARSADAALTDDGELTVALVAGGTYIVDVLVLFTSGATPDFKCALEFTGTTTDFTGIVDWQGAFPLDNANNDTEHTYVFTGATGGFDTLSGVPGNNTASTYGGARYSGLFRVGASGGNLKLKWAQNTSDPGNTTVLAGSYIIAERKT
jgi:hypothetical protein